MTHLVLMAVLQSVISVEAGLVNHVQGDVSVRSNENVAEGQPIRTGPGGYAEVLLTPGSLLRLGEGAEAVLDETDLTQVQVSLVSGAAVIEAFDVQEEYPITMVTGSLTTAIRRDGIFKFEDGRATVLEGALDVPAAGVAYEKGWSVFFDRIHRAARAGESAPTNVERWSLARSELLARANAQAYRSLRSSRRSLPDMWSWYWVPTLNVWTYFPARRYHSPYGHRYYTVVDVRRPEETYRGGGGAAGGGAGRPDASPGPATAGPSGGGGRPAPAPAEIYRGVVPAKNGPGTQLPN